MSTLLIPLTSNVCYIFNNSSNLKFVACSKLIACLLNPSVVVWGHLVGLQLAWGGGGLLPHMSIVIRGRWLWKVANINDRNTVLQFMLEAPWKCTSPLLSVGKLLRNKLVQHFYWSIQSKWKECFGALCTFRPTKHITKESDGFHNHSTQLTMIWS